jgi:transposase
MDDPGVRSLSFAEALASVTRLAERADQVAAALRKLREPEAAAVVAGLGTDADRTAAAIRALLVCVPRSTDWYEVHRQMWIRYGDPGDLAAMTDQVT